MGGVRAGSYSTEGVGLEASSRADDGKGDGFATNEVGDGEERERGRKVEKHEGMPWRGEALVVFEGLVVGGDEVFRRVRVLFSICNARAMSWVGAEDAGRGI